ncbi:MAG: 2-dehydropantoate 2-reductase [Deltaproteobacteria bacterium]|nr:2-dehydropantoate 2-reductase [Deltaproteobacteria bacterium]MBW2596136.1 2-dehydropantoate 2-reductase [Deltaproteobacteria bacterium]MBW2649566.1 2-dehydropantoate 2-reductase [Deltaproteobacteria bacterium]
MKIAIVGIGGVGGYYGGLLAKHYAGDENVEVVFIARGPHLEAIKTDGLQVMSAAAGNFTARPDLATDDPSDCGIFDIILLCVKGYDLMESARLLAPNTGENTIVISVLNGVDNAEKLKSVLDKGRIWNGCVYIGSHIVRPGVCRQSGGSCKMFFGSETNDETDGTRIENIFREAGIDAQYRTDINKIAWEKYLFVSPLANATTFLNTTIGGLLENREGMELMNNLLEELLALAGAYGVDFPEDIKESTIEKARVFPYEAKTSLQMDFEKGKRTEIETFVEFIVREAGRLGLPATTHERIYAALKARE